MTGGKYEHPSIWARIFGRYGRNMDGNEPLFFRKRIYERNRFSGEWRRIDDLG